MLFLFLILLFNYSIQSEILIYEEKLSEELVTCPFKSHVLCNFHNSHFLCLCYVSSTSPSTYLIKTCDEMFEIKFAEYNIMEFKIPLENFTDYNWRDFDHEIGLIFEDSTGANLTNFLFLRKYCVGNDILIQAIRLNEKVKHKGRKWSIRDVDLVHIRATTLDVIAFNKKDNDLNYKLKDIKMVSFIS